MVTVGNFCVAILMFFALSGCHSSCTKTTSKADAEAAKVGTRESNAKYLIDPEAIFKEHSNFSYKSELSISLNKADAHDENKEIVEIVANKPRILFQKKIDSYHFFELFKEGDNYLVKSQAGPWRKSMDNQQMYDGLLKDGINVTDWLIGQLNLSDLFLKQSSDDGKDVVFSISNKALPNDAPFFKNIAKNSYFSGNSQSVVNATITMDARTKFLKSASFDVQIVGQQRVAKITAAMTLDLGGHKEELSRPEVIDEEAAVLPVNIAPRFNELMDRELKKGK